MIPNGAIVPMATPTAGRDGGIDETALREYTGTLIEGGVDGLFPCGSIGEFTSLATDERRQVIETVVDASGSVPVIAGCGGTGVGAVCDHVEAASEAGADAAVVVNPYYLETTQEGIRDFYRTVADRATLPIVLYNIPSLTRHHVELETVVELSSVDGIVGIKDSSRDLAYHYRLVEETSESFDVLQGASELAVSALDVGADGFVSGAANVFPAVLAGIADAYRKGDRERAIGLMNEVVHPLLSAIDDIPSVVALKYLTSLSGPDVGEPLPPLPEASDEQRRRLEERYEELAARAAAAVD